MEYTKIRTPQKILFHRLINFGYQVLFLLLPLIMVFSSYRSIALMVFAGAQKFQQYALLGFLCIALFVLIRSYKEFPQTTKGISLAIVSTISSVLLFATSLKSLQDVFIVTANAQLFAASISIIVHQLFFQIEQFQKNQKKMNFIPAVFYGFFGLVLLSVLFVFNGGVAFVALYQYGLDLTAAERVGYVFGVCTLVVQHLQFLLKRVMRKQLP